MNQATPPPSSPSPATPREAPGATAGLVLGILSIVIGVPIVQLILALIGFQKAKQAKARCEADPAAYSNVGVATAGYVCSIIGIVLGCISLVCGCGYVLIIVFAILSGAPVGSP